ncbi:MAG: DNRLRE domain-containing protein [bacterium]|nr:DNRLRE domain-containing protein [bacterium]
MKKVIMLLALTVIVTVLALAQMPSKGISQPQDKNVKIEEETKTPVIPAIIETQTIVCPVVKDTWVYAFRPDSNYGKGYGWKDRTDKDKDITVPKMFLGFGGADKKAVLLQFDLSKLPKGKLAKKAVIKLYNDFAGSAAETKVDAKMVTKSWDEMKVTWKTKPSWTSAALSTTSLIGAIGYGKAGKWYEWDVTKMILVWMVNKRPNYGIALDPQGDSGVDRDFICKEYQGKEQFYPVLEVTYEKESPAKKPVPKDAKQ